MKNRDKYMKQIYKMIPTNYLVTFIGVNKKTGKPFCCNSLRNAKCEKCIFDVNDTCDFIAINKWLEQEEE